MSGKPNAIDNEFSFTHAYVKHCDFSLSTTNETWQIDIYRVASLRLLYAYLSNNLRSGIYAQRRHHIHPTPHPAYVGLRLLDQDIIVQEYKAL